MTGATRAASDTSDARAYFVLPLYSVRELWPVREALPHSAKHAVFVGEKPVAIDGYERPVGY